MILLFDLAKYMNRSITFPYTKPLDLDLFFMARVRVMA